MTSQQYQGLKNGDVIWVNYPCDDHNDANEFKPRNVVLLDKWSDSYCKVICITDLVNITNQKGITILAHSPEAISMKLVKDSFINFTDCQSIPSSSIKFYRGKCPKEIFDEILQENL